MVTYYEQYTFVTWLVVPWYIVTILTGTFGNLVVLRTYIKEKRIWNKPYNLILTHGVVADLIICAFFTPLLLLYRANAVARWIEYSPVCELSVFSSMLAISLQYVAFPLLSLNRRDVHLTPTEPWLTMEKCKKLLLAAWLLCILASGALVIILRVTIGHTDIPKLHRCILVNTRWDLFASFFLGYSTLLYAFSIAVAVKCYWKISITTCPEPSPTTDEARRTKICKIVTLVYSLFWTPFLVVQLSGLFYDYTEVTFNCHALSSAIGVFGSAVNPYLYSSMDHDYKKKFIAIAKRRNDES